MTKLSAISEFRGAHAPRVLAIAPPRSRTSSALTNTKSVLAKAPKPAREPRALPGIHERRPLNMKDFRSAFRQLLRQPGFTVLAVVALALGIGANTVLSAIRIDSMQALRTE